MSKYIRVEGSESQYRDSESGAIVNKDSEGFEQAKIRRAAAKKQHRTEEELNNLQDRLNMLETMMKKLTSTVGV